MMFLVLAVFTAILLVVTGLLLGTTAALLRPGKPRVVLWVLVALVSALLILLVAGVFAVFLLE